MRLQDKVAIVTGAGSGTGPNQGIGRAFAKLFLEEGATVVVGEIDETRGKEVADDLSDLGDISAVTLDVTDRASADSLAAEVVSRHGRIDILINNAGIAGPSDPWTTDVAEWDRVQAINLRAAYFCGRAAAIAMKAGGRGGAIVNVASVAGQIGGVATGPAYVASKAGLIGLTRSMARHFAPFAVRVNCLAPADIDTDMVAGWPPELRQRLTAMTPLGRFGRVDEAAAAACFLASDASSYLTGQTLNVNGGIYMG